jgi:hypothetical protein
VRREKRERKSRAGGKEKGTQLGLRRNYVFRNVSPRHGIPLLGDAESSSKAFPRDRGGLAFFGQRLGTLDGPKGEVGQIDVAAAEDDAHALAGHIEALFEQRRDGHGR